MRIRWIIEFAFSILITPFLYISEVHKHLIIYFGLCDLVTNESCIAKNTLLLLFFWIVFVIFVLLMIELVFYSIRKKKNKAAFTLLDSTTDPYEASLYIENKSYSKIEDCSAELLRVNVINKKGCLNIFNKEIYPDKTPKLFTWENGIEIKDLVKGGTIKIFGADKNERIFILTKKFFECDYIFTNRKRGKSARKAIYEIEIKISGRAKFDGVESVVEKTSCWKIFYSYTNHFTSQKVYIEEIDNLQEPNNLDLGENVGNKKTFSVIAYPVSNT